MTKTISVLGWMVTIVLQGIIGYVSGALLASDTFYPSMGIVPFTLGWWFGITAGIFLVGSLGLLLRKVFQLKKSLTRFGFTAAGVFIIVITTKVVGMSHPSHPSSPLNMILLILLSLNIPLAVLLGLVGFYIPELFKTKSSLSRKATG